MTEALVGQRFANQVSINMDFFATRIAGEATRKLVTIAGKIVAMDGMILVVIVAHGIGGIGGLHAKTRTCIISHRMASLIVGYLYAHLPVHKKLLDCVISTPKQATRAQ